MWAIHYTATFSRQYSRLDSQIKERVDNAIRILSESNDPEKLGEPKKGPLKHSFAYGVGRKYRLLYSVYRKEITILLLKVGKHKDVYGKD